MSIKGRKKSSEIQGKWESWTCRAIKSPSKLPLLAEGAILGSVCVQLSMHNQQWKWLSSCFYWCSFIAGSFSAKMLVLNIKIISVSYVEKHNSLLFTYFFIVQTQLFVYLFIEWLVNYFSPHTQVLCMYLVFCFISPPVDSYLESMAEGKSVFTSTDSPYCTIDQSTDTRE